MPPISDETRFQIWVVTGIASVLFTVLAIALEANIAYYVRRIIEREARGRRPKERSIIAWLLLAVMALLTVSGAAIASSAPAHEPNPTITPSNPTLSFAGTEELVTTPTISPPTISTPINTPTRYVIKNTTPTIAPPPDPSPGDTWFQVVDGMEMVYVPAGEFTMGQIGEQDEMPVHTVTLDAYWIDKTEVTNEMYAKCVQGGGCNPPSKPTYYSDSNYADYAVVFVSWIQANAYCTWADRRLPTEAEWEKAARGTDGNIYPWGNEFDGNLLNSCDKNCPRPPANKSVDDGYKNVAPVGSYPLGKSIYGALDMAGNVWEWVSSLDGPYPYDATDGRENPDSSDGRVIRGGSWYVTSRFATTFNRNWDLPEVFRDHLGFRCARSS